ncbi:plastocyanin/azurin family copper-binding protein [Halorussus litoreus]|uniref:plastocyanin/azurin family copper-binding protein n=1 Tax=Halorussus litoreus TaxID=1710536 RepID=UPI000E25132D|nr:plastocyanin/azurin family copper-binding protein [Halorussus litoreus]
MRRRAFLGVTSGVALGGLAGCAAPFGANEETTEPEDEGAVGETDTTTAETTAADTTAADGETTAEGETTADGETTAADETTAGEETTAGGGGTETVQMNTDGSEYYFDPIGLYVEPGTTVEWVNESGAHSSTAYAEGNGGAEVTRIPDDAEPWNSETLTEAGATFSYTFEVEGTYDYFCIPHKALGMVARVVCGEPGDVEGDPPDGAVPDAQTIVDEGAIAYSDFDGG